MKGAQEEHKIVYLVFYRFQFLSNASAILDSVWTSSAKAEEQKNKLNKDYDSTDLDVWVNSRKLDTDRL